MKTLLILFTGIFISSALFAQTIEYSYDENGNRVSRTVVYLKSSKSLKSAPADTTAKEQPPAEPVTDKKGAIQINVYPNPTEGELQVRISGAESATCTITIVNTSGKPIYKNEQFGLSGTIDLSRQPHGVYIMRIEVDDKVSEWMVVRE